MALQLRKRINATMVGRINARGQIEQHAGSKRAISPERVVLVTQPAGGTVLRIDGERADVVLAESLDDMVAASDGALIKLTPVGFADIIKGEDHSQRGQFIAVNPDYVTVLPTKDRRGTHIGVANSPRDIVVAETADEIQDLMDGN